MIDPTIIADHDQHLAIVRDHLATLDPDDLRAIIAEWRAATCPGPNPESVLLLDRKALALLTTFATLGLTTGYLSAMEVLA